MTFRLPLLLLALSALPQTAQAAPFNNMIEICADADRKPAEALKFCYNALDARQMDRQPAEVRAKVLMNAGIAALNLGRYGEAADNQTRALEIDPTLGAAYASRAQAYRQVGRTAEAMADYDQAVRYSPRDANAWLGRGVMLLKAGDAPRALQDFDRAVSLQPGWSAPRYNRGVTLLLLGEYPRAERDFSEVISQNPDDAQALVNRGKARAAQGRRNAGGDFDQALRLRPEWGEGWFARGDYHDQAGRVEAANADYLRAYQLGHSDPRLLERVQRIGGG